MSEERQLKACPKMLVKLVLIFAFAASAAHGHVQRRRPMVMAMSGVRPISVKEHRPLSLVQSTGSKKLERKPPSLLRMAYSACGLATSAAWTTVVRTTIRSNQPLGALMPSSTHALFARMGVLSAVPLIASCYIVLASASKATWEESREELGSPTCRRLNLALAASGVGSALWVGFAPIITRIPNSGPLVMSQVDGRLLVEGAHAAYRGVRRAALIGAYGSAAALSAAVWARALPEDVRSKPWTWPGRVADGVAQSLVSLAPKCADDPVDVKYSLLFASFGLFTAMGFGPFPAAVCPSWTGRRCSRAFPAVR